MAGNGWKWQASVGNEWQTLENTGNGLKRLELPNMAGNGWTQLELLESLEIVRNGWNGKKNGWKQT